ncbi:MAG: hypothetical protein AAFX54_12820 [Pseudomonadota bacterium]
MSDAQDKTEMNEEAVNGQEKGQAPLRTIRDGQLSSSVWETQGPDGPFMTAKIVRNYRDTEGKFRETSSFSESDLRRLPDLARNTTDIMTALRHDQQLARDVREQMRQDQQATPMHTAQATDSQKTAYVEQRRQKTTAAPTQGQRIQNKQGR